MQIIGNIAVALAALIFVLPMQLLFAEASSKRNDGGALWGAIFVLIPLWGLLAIALVSATARGGFDWTGANRGTQYGLVILSSIALLVVTFFSFMFRVEHASQLPWSARAFSIWAMYLFPLVTMAFAFLVLNPSFGAKVPALAYRIPMVVVAGLSLLASAGMLLEMLVHSHKQQMARIERAVAEGNERDRSIMARVQTLNPTNDFAELLGFANRFENADIRQVAISKAEAHPQFTEALVRILKNGWAEKGLVYLDACEPPDRKAVAEPVRDAIAVLTTDAKDSVERTHTFYAEQFDWNTRIILSCADKFSNEGVDYIPAIREYRRALDAQRTRNVQLNARQTLDAWLSKHAKMANHK